MPNFMSNLTFDIGEEYNRQITESLNLFYSSPSKTKTPIERLRLRRNRLINQMRVVVKKLLELEEEYFEPVINSVKQAEDLKISLDIFREIFVNEREEKLWVKLSEKDKYLSKLYKSYLKALMDVDLEIIALENQSITIET